MRFVLLEHAVSKPINMQGHGQNSQHQINDIMSPSESGGLYVKMVENVLASSPMASSLKYVTVSYLCSSQEDLDSKLFSSFFRKRGTTRKKRKRRKLMQSWLRLVWRMVVWIQMGMSAECVQGGGLWI